MYKNNHSGGLELNTAICPLCTCNRNEQLFYELEFNNPVP
jgi:hypothetical protein